MKAKLTKKEIAIDKAINRSLRTGKEYFVILEFGEYQVCNEYDLDGFYSGCPVIISTEDLKS